jgi:hypothetical protein
MISKLKALARLKETAAYIPAPLQQSAEDWESNRWTVTFKNADYSALYAIVNGVFDANEPTDRTLLVRDTQLKLDFTINPALGYGFTMFLPQPLDGDRARTLCFKFLSKWLKGVALGPVNSRHPFDIEVARWIQPEVTEED